MKDVTNQTLFRTRNGFYFHGMPRGQGAMTCSGQPMDVEVGALSFSCEYGTHSTIQKRDERVSWQGRESELEASIRGAVKRSICKVAPGKLSHESLVVAVQRHRERNGCQFSIKNARSTEEPWGIQITYSNRRADIRYNNNFTPPKLL